MDEQIDGGKRGREGGFVVRGLIDKMGLDEIRWGGNDERKMRLSLGWRK